MALLCPTVGLLLTQCCTTRSDPDGGTNRSLADTTPEGHARGCGAAARFHREPGAAHTGLFLGRHVPYRHARKEAVTVEDLLPMRSGLECVAAPSEVTLAEMVAGPDWMQFFLDRAVATSPGQTWVFWAEYRSSVSSFQ